MDKEISTILERLESKADCLETKIDEHTRILKEHTQILRTLEHSAQINKTEHDELSNEISQKFKIILQI